MEEILIKVVCPRCGCESRLSIDLVRNPERLTIWCESEFGGCEELIVVETEIKAVVRTAAVGLFEVAGNHSGNELIEYKPVGADEKPVKGESAKDGGECKACGGTGEVLAEECGVCGVNY